MSKATSPAVEQTKESNADYIAPLPLPTGEKPVDMLNAIWRKNDVFIDVGTYAIGAAIVLLWTQIVMFSLLAYYTGLLSMVWTGLAIVVPSSLYLGYILCCPVPLPLRFNRQRREVCVPQQDGSYWIVPWESVTAAAPQLTGMGPGGQISVGMLFIGFENPDADAPESHKHFYMGFNCGGGESAMSQWECIRTFMEDGPDATPDCRLGPKAFKDTQIGSIIIGARDDEVLEVLKGLFFIIFLGSYFAEKTQDLKLSPPPDLHFPDIIEWSKPIPPEQWAQRSPELDAAIRQREAELATPS